MLLNYNSYHSFWGVDFYRIGHLSPSWSSVRRIFEYIFGYSNICLRIFYIRIWILEIWLIEYIRIRICVWSKIEFCKGQISEYIRIFEYLSPNNGYSNMNIGNLTLRIYLYSYSVKKTIFALLWYIHFAHLLSICASDLQSFWVDPP